MKRMSKFIVFLGFLMASMGCGASGTDSNSDGQDMGDQISNEAVYQITFVSLWEEQAHLGRPGNAHFSPLVFAAHTTDYALIPIGGLTSPALEDVAELGRTGLIEGELGSAVSEGLVDNFMITSNQFVPETLVQTRTIRVTKESSLFSLVSMIAPSPDWVVGVDSLSLLDTNNSFIEDTGDILLFALDAGTEGPDFGGRFTINGTATLNPTPIQRLIGPGFEVPFAMLRLTKVN